MKEEALKLVLEALENISTALREDDVLGSDIELMLNTITAVKEALAQPPLPMQPTEKEKISRQMTSEIVAARTLAQPEQERYFCQRCGKPVNLTTIHTCTPPRENT